MLQHVLIPCYQQAFEAGHSENVIGGPPAPDQDNPNNVISVFITQVCVMLSIYCHGKSVLLFVYVGYRTV